MSKYMSRKVTISGMTFDSQKEARRWRELVFLERAGKITGLQRQVQFELIPAQYETYERYGKRGQRLKDGRRCIEKSCSYFADFVYHDAAGKLVVEDTKSPATRTEAYLIKRKLMLHECGIRIMEV